MAMPTGIATPTAMENGPIAVLMLRHTVAPNQARMGWLAKIGAVATQTALRGYANDAAKGLGAADGRSAPSQHSWSHIRDSYRRKKLGRGRRLTTLWYRVVSASCSAHPLAHPLPRPVGGACGNRIPLHPAAAMVAAAIGMVGGVWGDCE